MSYTQELTRIKNKLLVRDVVGQVKQSTFDLPQDGHVYGYSRDKDRENAKQVTMSWQYHNNSLPRQPARNFKELNKLSLQEKCIKPKAVAQFRREVDVREKLREGRQGVELVLPAEDFRYGKANKPSTPMYDVMGFEYANRADLQRVSQLQTRLENEKEKRRQARLTHALRISSNVQSSKNSPNAVAVPKTSDYFSNAADEFKLSRFRNVPSKVGEILRPSGSTVPLNTSQQPHLHLLNRTVEVQ